MLNYKTIGSGPSLVLLHGFGFCGEIFTQLVDKYQDKYQITIVDLPGHGESSNLVGLDSWSAEIAKIVPANSIILGWSLGGLLAIKIANIIPIKKVILCASSPKFTQNSCWQFGILPKNFQSFASNIRLNISKGLTRFISLQGVEKSQIKDLKTIINNNLPTMDGLNNALDILLNADLRDEIKNIENIEVFLGKKDTIVPVKIADWYRQNNIKTTIFKCGHLPFLDEKFVI